MYRERDVDFFALVAINERLIYFVLPEKITSSMFRVRVDKLNDIAEAESLSRVMETVSE